MKKKNSKSKFWRLNKSDLFKGLLLAIIVGLLTTITECLSSWEQWPTRQELSVMAFAIFKTSFLTIIGYLIKNVLTNSDGKLLAKEKNV